MRFRIGDRFVVLTGHDPLNIGVQSHILDLNLPLGFADLARGFDFFTLSVNSLSRF